MSSSSSSIVYADVACLGIAAIITIIGVVMALVEQNGAGAPPWLWTLFAIVYAIHMAMPAKRTYNELMFLYVGAILALFGVMCLNVSSANQDGSTNLSALDKLVSVMVMATLMLAMLVSRVSDTNVSTNLQGSGALGVALVVILVYGLAVRGSRTH